MFAPLHSVQRYVSSIECFVLYIEYFLAQDIVPNISMGFFLEIKNFQPIEIHLNGPDDEVVRISSSFPL